MDIDLRLRATRQLSDALRPDGEFPGPVLSSDWTRFLFFDSDRMLDESAASAMRLFATVERADVICVANLEMIGGAEFLAYRYVGPDVTGRQLREMGADDPTGPWLYALPRIACMSEKGRWCLYSDGRAEFGIVSFRSAADQLLFQPGCEALNAVSLEVALGTPLCYAFDQMPPDWRASLAAAYAG